MREITDHKVNDANDLLKITAIDEPGVGGANHVYHIEPPPNPQNEVLTTTLLFQNGAIADSGVNGITQEALLAIVADRLRSFQAGPFANPFNAGALSHVEAALTELKNRTKERMARGVEGTMQQ